MRLGLIISLQSAYTDKHERNENATSRLWNELVDRSWTVCGVDWLHGI